MQTITIPKGATLSQIAAQYGTTVAALQKQNGIKNANDIQAGATLQIPSGTSASAGTQVGNSFYANLGNADSAIPQTTTASATKAQNAQSLNSSKTTASSTNSGGSTANTGGSQYANGLAPDDPSNKYNTETGAPNSNYNPGASGNGQYTYTKNANGTYDVMSNGEVIGTSTTPSLTGTFTPNTGSSTTDQIVNSAQAVTAQQLAAGNTINPNLSITPALVSQFLSEAHSQMDPEGQQALTNEIDQVNLSLGNLQTQYNNQVAISQQQFQQGLLQERTASGDAGMAQSGARNLVENQMLNAQNLNLSSLASTAQNQIGQTLNAAGMAIGQGSQGLNGNLSNINTPSLYAATGSLGGLGGAGANGGALNYNFNPSNYSVGSLNQAYGTALTGSANQFLSSYLQSAANNSPAAGANGGQTFQDLNNTPTLQ